MTNKELVKELQKTIDKYGEVPVTIDYSYSDNVKNNELVRDILADEDGVIIYNWK